MVTVHPVHTTAVRRTKNWLDFHLTGQVACTMQVSWRTEEKEAGKGLKTLEVKTGKKIKLSAQLGFHEAEIKDNLPVMSGKMRNKNVQVLRDSVCYEMVVKREVMDEADFIQKMGNMMMVD